MKSLQKSEREYLLSYPSAINLLICSLIPSSNKKEDSRVNIEFLTWPIIRYKREVLFGWVDLLVSFGGIAGLFLGFSLLSGVEIIYYFTMRAGCMLFKNRVRDRTIDMQGRKG